MIADSGETGRVPGRGRRPQCPGDPTGFIRHGIPDDGFWARYGQLWRTSRSRSPFQSPHFLRALAARSNHPVAVYESYDDEGLLGAAVFHKPGVDYRFLSDLKTDHNFFVIREGCPPAALRGFFDVFLEQVRSEHWALTLNRQPDWLDAWKVFTASLRESELFWDVLRYSVCPMTTMATAQEIAAHLTGSRNTRRKRRRLQRDHGAWFEVLEDGEQLEAWLEDFTAAHIARWSTTDTPSEYRSPARRSFLQACLRAWARDGLLIRFSLVVGGRRIALCIGLREQGTVIHHSHTYDRDFGRYSPGKILLHEIGGWLGRNGISRLDFGDGGEPFKYDYANEEHGLHRVFISSRTALLYRAKALTVRTIRSHDALYGLYLNRIKPHLSSTTG